MTSFKDRQLESAQLYSAYRPRYPQELIDDLRKQTIGNDAKVLVDWGCGTGELTLPLAPFFDRVEAIDVSQAMVTVAQAKAKREHIHNVEWTLGKAEELELAPASCDLVTSASAFHWMDRDGLAERALAALKPDCSLALVAGGGGRIWKGTTEWSKVMAECLKNYIPEPREAGKRRYNTVKTQDEVLDDAGFEVDGADYSAEYQWRVDEVIGFAYTLSFALPHALGDKRLAFEDELRRALVRTNPSGVFNEVFTFRLTIGRRPRNERLTDNKPRRRL